MRSGNISRKRTPSPEEQIIRVQLYDWGHWRRLQTFGIGFTNPNNVKDTDYCLDESVSEDVNRAYIVLRDNFKLRARIIKSFYVDRKPYREIADEEHIGVMIIRQQKLIAEGWIDHAVNYL